jgi:drug/metabolite transporter (DMT)-like permease
MTAQTTARPRGTDARGAGGGLRYMVASAFFFSVMSLLVKVAGARIPTFELVFARAFVVAALSWMAIRARRVAVRNAEWRLLLLRGVLGLVALSCFYYSVVHLPLAEATVIQFTNPVFTAILAAVFLGEALRRKELALALVSLVGVAVIVRPMDLLRGMATGLPPLAVLSAVGGAVFSAGAYVMVRRLRRHDAMVVVFYFAAVSVVGVLPLLPTFIAPARGEWLLLLGVGVATFGGQITLTIGLQRERAARATAIGYLQIVFAVFWGIVVFAEVPGSWSLVGSIIVVASTFGLSRLRGTADVEAPAQGRQGGDRAALSVGRGRGPADRPDA